MRGRLPWVALLTCVAMAATSGAAAAHELQQRDPVKAAAILVAKLRSAARRTHTQTFAATRVVVRSGRRWLAVGRTSRRGTRVGVYAWTGARWKLDGRVAGAELGPAQWIVPASLTGSVRPDFAIEGCGAGDTNCLSVVSSIGGRWHAVPFEYGYGLTLEVNGLPQRSRVWTEVDACGCAGGPSTFLYERYRNGAFRPANAPGGEPACSAQWLNAVAGNGAVPLFQFDRVVCAHGWALAVGSGSGYAGNVFGLFNQTDRGKGWRLLTLDNGDALPAAPAIYDLPLSLFSRLAGGLGPSTARVISAAKLIAQLQVTYRFSWPAQNGIVSTPGASWLVAVVPAGPARNDSSAYPVSAVIYRWNGTSWAIDGHVTSLPASLNLPWSGGWFVSVAVRSVGSVAFARAGSFDLNSPRARSTRVITNAGGTWHVAQPHGRS